MNQGAWIYVFLFAWLTISLVTAQAKPDLVLGAGMLSLPEGVLLDPNSDALNVVDTGNSRILRFDDRASLSASSVPSLIIGQRTLNSTALNAGRNTSALGLAQPGGACMDGLGGLWVADSLNNRVMLFVGVANSTVSGITAVLQLGQPTFQTSRANQGGSYPTAATLDNPASTRVENNTLWVADLRNNRFRKTINFPVSTR